MSQYHETAWYYVAAFQALQEHSVKFLEGLTVTARFQLLLHITVLHTTHIGFGDCVNTVSIHG